MGAGVDRSVAIVEIALVLPQLMHLLLLLYSDGIHVLPRARAHTRSAVACVCALDDGRDRAPARLGTAAGLGGGRSTGFAATGGPAVCRSRALPAIAATYAHSRSAACAGLYHFIRSRARMLTLVLTGSITIDVALTALYNYPHRWV